MLASASAPVVGPQATPLVGHLPTSRITPPWGKGDPSGDDLFSTPKPSRSFDNSDLRHLWHSSDSNHLPVPDMFQSSSYSEPLPAIHNTTMHSLHHSTSPNISFEGCSKTSAASEGNLKISSDSTPSNPNSTPTVSGYSPGCSRDGAAPAASDIKGHIVGVIHDIKG